MRTMVMLALFGGFSLVACDATSQDDSGETEGNESAAASASASTGITTTGPVTTASDAMNDTDGPPPGTSCEMCLYVWCDAALEACFADDNCSCWVDCGETMSDEQCAQLCGTPGPVVIELIGCFQETCGEACSGADTTGPGDETDTGGDGETGTGGVAETDSGGTTDGTTGTDAGSTETTG